MLTIDRQLKNKATLIELKSATSPKQRNESLQKLGGAIKATITRLKQLRIEIQVQTRLKVIAHKMAEYEKVSNDYNELQLSLAEIDDNSQMVQRIKAMNKEFIETHDPAELSKKLDSMKAERVQHLQSESGNEMNYLNEGQQQLTGELLYADKYAVRSRIVAQEKDELVEIERLITRVKDIASKTSIMINSQGEKIELSLEKMKRANVNLREGNQNLVGTNEYQQDTNKKFMVFCCLTVVIVSIVLLILYSSRSKP